MLRSDFLSGETRSDIDLSQVDTSLAASLSLELAESVSASTLRSYVTALRYWCAWYAGRYGAPLILRVPEEVVMQFIVDHWARQGAGGPVWGLPVELDAALVAAGFKRKRGPFRQTTLNHRVMVLDQVHQQQGVPSPCNDAGVRRVLHQVRCGRDVLPLGWQLAPTKA